MIFESLHIFVHVVLTLRGVARFGIGCDVGEEREPGLDFEWQEENLYRIFGNIPLTSGF